jgi:hypothetical protein
MADIRKKQVADTSVFQLKNIDGSPMFWEDEDGKEDKNRPCMVEVYSPGTKQYARAQAAQNNRLMDKMKSRNKSKITAEKTAEEKAEFLSDCTKVMSNIEYDRLTGEALHKAVYGDITIGFIADQVSEQLGDWENFTKKSATA